MENTAICGNISTETIRREEHSALSVEEQNHSPQRLVRSGCEFKLESLYDYYLLGYTSTDGCVGWYPQRHDYYMQWTSVDRWLLDGVQRKFEGRGHIFLKPKNKEDVVRKNGKVISEIENQQQQYVLVINSKQLCSDFMSYGILPRKTYDPQLPELIEDDQMWSYLAGVIDGDGCWWYPETTKRSPSIHQSIRSFSRTYLERIQAMLKERANLIGGVYDDGDDGSPRLVYSTRPALIIYEHLPRPFCLPRKLQVVEDFVALRGGWDNIKRKCRSCGTRFIKYRHNQLYCTACHSQHDTVSSTR